MPVKNTQEEKITQYEFYLNVSFSRLERKTNTTAQNLLIFITNVIKKIEGKRYGWYSQVKRMRNHRLPKLLKNRQPKGRNRRQS